MSVMMFLLGLGDGKTRVFHNMVKLPLFFSMESGEFDERDIAAVWLKKERKYFTL